MTPSKSKMTACNMVKMWAFVAGMSIALKRLPNFLESLGFLNRLFRVHKGVVRHSKYGVQVLLSWNLCIFCFVWDSGHGWIGAVGGQYDV